MKLMITGATGFVGNALLNKLLREQYELVAVTRAVSRTLKKSTVRTVARELTAEQHWGDILQGVDVVVHLAARVHLMKDNAVDPLSECREVNTHATLNLAKQAADAGVKRFIFMSTIKVNGETSPPNAAFKESDISAPVDPYAISKWEAEQGLQRLAQQTGMEVVVIRPPLVYGPGVKGNFASLMRWISRGWPLPFGAVENKRSILALENLIDFIETCLTHPAAGNELFLVADREALTSAELAEKIATAHGRQVRLWPAPTSVMTFLAGLSGKGSVVQRLFGSLCIDASKAEKLLGWVPKVTIEQQLHKIVENQRSKDN